MDIWDCKLSYNSYHKANVLQINSPNDFKVKSLATVTYLRLHKITNVSINKFQTFFQYTAPEKETFEGIAIGIVTQNNKDTNFLLQNGQMIQTNTRQLLQKLNISAIEVPDITEYLDIHLSGEKDGNILTLVRQLIQSSVLLYN